MTSGPFSGWGVGFRGLAVWRYVALGAGIDTVSLSASGVAWGNSQPFEKSFRSTYGGALVRARLPVGLVTPYAELGLGYAWISNGSSTNTQCSYQSSINASVAAGADIRITRGLDLGVRWEFRRPSASGSCNDAYGPWGFEFQSLHMLAMGASYRW